MNTTEMKRSGKVLCSVALLAGALWPITLNAQSGPKHIDVQDVRGTWYLALDAEPFGLPPGANLPGLATFHSDKTFLIVDGGDFGGLPFDTRHTAQFGSWRQKGDGVEAVSLFLQGDAITDEVRSWQKVHLMLHSEGRDRLVGTANVFDLPCDGPAPFPVFGCPNPIASAADFVALPPFDIPIELERLRAKFALPE